MTGNRDVKILSMSTERGDTQSIPASPPYRYRYGYGILLSRLKVGIDGFISFLSFSVRHILAGTNNNFNLSMEYNYTRRRAFKQFQSLSIVNSINCMIHNFSCLTRFHSLYFRYFHNRGKFDSS